MLEGNNGVTTKTPERILFGAGTIHRGLKFTKASGEGATTGTWNFKDSIVGSTSGGSSLAIVPTSEVIEVDGMHVPVKGMRPKTGETAIMKINFIELSKDLITASLLAKTGTSEDTAYDLIESKDEIVTGDYWDNIAFVGKTVAGKNIIAILPNALCTSGMELASEDKKGAVPELTFECHADLADDGTYNKLPWKIYYPKTTATA